MLVQLKRQTRTNIDLEHIHLNPQRPAVRKIRGSKSIIPNTLYTPNFIAAKMDSECANFNDASMQLDPCTYELIKGFTSVYQLGRTGRDIGEEGT